MSHIIDINDAELVRPLIGQWEQEANNEELDILIDVNCVLSDIANMIVSPQGTVFGLVRDKLVVGFMGVNVFRSPTGPQLMANEHYFYVAPGYRGIASVRLLKEAKRWAKRMGCTHILFSASRMASDKHDMVCALYKKLGGKPFESTFIAEVV